MKTLRQLEDENWRLKQMVAARAGHPGTEGDHRKKLVRPKAKRMAAQWMAERFGLSLRRVCQLGDVDRNTLRYQSRRSDDQRLRARVREMAEAKRRYGCPRIFVWLRREWWRVYAKRIYRLYTEDGLTVRTKHRTKAAGLARVLQPRATAPNQRWSMDFMSARVADGRWFRILTIVDQFTRECLCMAAGQSFTGEKVAEAWEPVVVHRGTPCSITVDNGSEFASCVTDAWAYRHGIQLEFIRPRKPVEHGFIESFNGRLRDECVTVGVCFTLEYVRATFARWQEDCKFTRPPSALQDQAPATFAADWVATVQTAHASPELLETLT
ncbi:MAG: IS3 family transposase [Nitrospiraceae bacterium]|nr:IS3 family transposase [Nitrospiraceae bacterium]